MKNKLRKGKLSVLTLVTLAIMGCAGGYTVSGTISGNQVSSEGRCYFDENGNLICEIEGGITIPSNQVTDFKDEETEE